MLAGVRRVRTKEDNTGTGEAKDGRRRQQPARVSENAQEASLQIGGIRVEAVTTEMAQAAPTSSTAAKGRGNVSDVRVIAP